jgi:protein-disulfide isomerase
MQPVAGRWFAVAFVLGVGSFSCASREAQQGPPLACPSAGLDAQGVVRAKVNGMWLTEENVRAEIGTELDKLESDQRQQLFHLRWIGLERALDKALMAAEAKRRGISPEELTKTEIDARVHSPTSAEIEAFYKQHDELARIPLEAIVDRIAEHLQDQQRDDLHSDLIDGLRKGITVEYQLYAPLLPRMTVPLPDGDSWGNPGAAVTVIEFSDFQCPYCARATFTLNDVLREYGPKVRRVFRNFPLPSHENAVDAAVAAECARLQKLFWPMHDLIFMHQDALDADNLKAYAQQAGLDVAQYEHCITEPAAGGAIKADRELGKQLGIDGTPTIFINGQRISGWMPPPLLRSYLEAELARLEKQPAATPPRY